MIRTTLAVLAVGLLCGLCPALAADEQRKIDFAAKILDQHGQPVPECIRNRDRYDANKGCADWVDLTLGHLAMTALNQGDAELRGDAFTRRMKLGLRVLDAGELELGVDDIKLIKDQVEKLAVPQQRFGGQSLYSPLVVFRAQQLLDPAGTK